MNRISILVEILLLSCQAHIVQQYVTQWFPPAFGLYSQLLLHFRGRSAEKYTPLRLSARLFATLTKESSVLCGGQLGIGKIKAAMPSLQCKPNH